MFKNMNSNEAPVMHMKVKIDTPPYFPPFSQRGTTSPLLDIIALWGLLVKKRIFSLRSKFFFFYIRTDPDVEGRQRREW